MFAEKNIKWHSHRSYLEISVPNIGVSTSPPPPPPRTSGLQDAHVFRVAIRYNIILWASLLIALWDCITGTLLEYDSTYTPTYLYYHGNFAGIEFQILVWKIILEQKVQQSDIVCTPV